MYFHGLRSRQAAIRERLGGGDQTNQRGEESDNIYKKKGFALLPLRPVSLVDCHF